MVCKKDVWPKIKESISSKLKVLKKLNTLGDITATYLGGSLGPDRCQRKCVIDLKVNDQEVRYENSSICFGHRRGYILASQ